MTPFHQSDVVRFAEQDDTLFFHQKISQDIFLPNSLEPKGTLDRRQMLRVDLRQLSIDLSIIQSSYGPFTGIVLYGKACREDIARAPILNIGFGNHKTSLRDSSRRKKIQQPPEYLNVAICCDTNRFRQVVSDVTMDTVKDRDDNKELKTWQNACRFLLIPKNPKECDNFKTYNEDYALVKSQGVLLAGNFPYRMLRYYNWDSQMIRSCVEDCKTEELTEANA